MKFTFEPNVQTRLHHLFGMFSADLKLETKSKKIFKRLENKFAHSRTYVELSPAELKTVDELVLMLIGTAHKVRVKPEGNGIVGLYKKIKNSKRIEFVCSDIDVLYRALEVLRG